MKHDGIEKKKIIFDEDEYEEFIGHLGNYKQIENLHISGIQLERLTDDIVELKNLRELKIRKTNITELPENLGKLSSLERLEIWFNKIKRLPDSIVELNNLRELEIYEMNMTELPENIGKLSGLERLTIRSNEIQRLPDSIVELNNLRELEITAIKIAELPDIGKMRGLEYLYVKESSINKWEERIGSMTKTEIQGVYTTEPYVRKRIRVMIERQADHSFEMVESLRTIIKNNVISDLGINKKMAKERVKEATMSLEEEEIIERVRDKYRQEFYQLKGTKKWEGLWIDKKT